MAFDKLAGAGSVDVLSLAYCLDAVVDVGGDEDTLIYFGLLTAWGGGFLY